MFGFKSYIFGFNSLPLFLYILFYTIFYFKLSQKKEAQQKQLTYKYNELIISLSKEEKFILFLFIVVVYIF